MHCKLYIWSVYFLSLALFELNMCLFEEQIISLSLYLFTFLFPSFSSTLFFALSLRICLDNKCEMKKIHIKNIN
mgnify:CR=1 FL=1